uniref:Uncharacterized protein n=1 Tax=Panagrolaimus sp. PS1159 TaxID=55785 RepID=A0AC35GWA3_9BILA
MHWKKKDESSTTTTTTSNNKSTLSLHIAAYANLNEAVAFDSLNESFEKSRSFKEQKQNTSASTFVFQNPFELPRQQNGKVSEPEMSQFKASQRLFNSGAASNGVQRNAFLRRLQNRENKFGKKI